MSVPPKFSDFYDTLMTHEPDRFSLRVNQDIHLSAVCPSDKPAFVEYLNDREIFERTLRIPYPYTLADADHFLARDAEATARLGHPIHFAIRNLSGKAIGGVGFEGLAYGHKAEIGYWLAKPYWGQGIMTLVVGALCAWAFAEWKLVRITAHVFLFNDASAKVLEKNGFLLEGVLRKHHQKDGNFLDAKLYALVR